MKTNNKTNCGLFFGVLLTALLGSASTWAASVTTNQAGMNAIFSQASFGANTIDIRFNPVVSVAGPLAITSAADLATLFALAPAASPTVDMFFIDSIGFCGVAGDADGCATVSGNTMAIVSSVAAGVNGAELNAHELGHNLGLSHSSPGLMSAAGYGNTTLTVAQVTAILASVLVQTDIGGGQFISITPILVTPLPGALPLVMSGLSMLGFIGIKRKSHMNRGAAAC